MHDQNSCMTKVVTLTMLNPFNLFGELRCADDNQLCIMDGQAPHERHCLHRLADILVAAPDVQLG